MCIRDRYQHEEIYKLFRRQEEVAQFAYGLDRNKENEISLIYDQESCHTVSMYTHTLMLDYYLSLIHISQLAASYQ